MTATGQIDMFNPTSGTLRREWAVVPAVRRRSNPARAITGVTAGPDGDIYFTAQGAGQVGWFNPSALAATSNSNTDSVIGFANTPNASAVERPMGIAAGPDGNVWFTETNGATGNGAIGVADLATHLAITTPPPSSVTAGSTFGLTTKVTYRHRRGRHRLQRHRDGDPGERPRGRLAGRDHHGLGRQRRGDLHEPDPRAPRAAGTA